MLEARGISWEAGGKLILNHIDLHLEAGSRVGLAGPNGSGKSSLLKILSFLQAPTAGQIIFKGECYGRRIPLSVRRKIGIVFQDHLLLNMTAHDNLAVGLKMRGFSKGEIHQRIGEWLERFGVGHLEHQRSRTLSGGEAQRVSLARAFSLEPEVLFLDEPFHALDAPIKEALLMDLSRILPSSGTTILMVSHSFREIEMLTQRALIMVGGKIVADDQPKALLSTSQIEEVESFLRHNRTDSHMEK